MLRSYPFIPKELPYAFNALEPVIGEETLYYHYEKLYKNYINRLNRAIEANPEYKNLSLEVIIKKSHDIPKDMEINRSAGGVYNHEMYFESLSPNPAEPVNSAFWNAVDADYSRREDFYEDIADVANKVFGSGYAWVAAEDNGKIYIAQYENQNTPLPQNANPLLPIDVWEHAYYLDYRQQRAEYIEKLFEIIDWNVISERYLKGM